MNNIETKGGPLQTNCFTARYTKILSKKKKNGTLTKKFFCTNWKKEEKKSTPNQNLF